MCPWGPAAGRLKLHSLCVSPSLDLWEDENLKGHAAVESQVSKNRETWGN
jgi:hypothetical protein